MSKATSELDRAVKAVVADDPCLAQLPPGPQLVLLRCYRFGEALPEVSTKTGLEVEIVRVFHDAGLQRIHNLLKARDG